MTTIIKPTARGAAGADGGESDLGTVRTYDFCVSAHTRASSIVARFEQDPGLPGVIVERDGEILGVLSRQVCLEHLSLPFGSALFRDAPVEKMFDQHPQSPMVLTQGMSIQAAVDRCLARPRDQVYAPAIVKAADGRLKLLSMYDLIVTQSRCLVRANRTIQEQIKAVEEASRAKGTFLANMSHEIRTPMNAVPGMADLLLDTSLTPRQREYLGIITEAGQTLLAIINDILDFSKIEAGKLALERTPFALQQTIGDRCLRAGMDHYVSKPIRADALGKTMQETLLSCGRLTPSEHFPTPVPPDSRAPSDITCELPSLAPASESFDLEPVDWEAALAIFAGNKPLLMLATETFLEERTKLVNAVREAIARRETAMVENACHCLKGALRYFGPTEAGTLAQQLEFAAKARSLNGSSDMFDALDRAIAALVPALDRYLATGRALQCVH